MPTWVHVVIYATCALVALAVVVGAWLLWRDHRRLTTTAQRLENTNESLSDTAGRFARLVHDMREAMSQMRWGSGGGDKGSSS